MGGVGQHYCLRWNNYQSNMTSVFHTLLQSESFVDVTLACNENSLKAHKVVLSACSSYFQKLLLDNPCKHPTIILPPDVCFSDLKFIIEFVYRGEIDVSQAELQSLLRTADQLKIKGLCEVGDDEDGEGNDPLGPDVTLDTIQHIQHESSQRHRLFSKFKNRYPTAQVKRKMHFDTSSQLPRKYADKSLMNNAEGLIHTSTINTNDILDTSRQTFDSMHSNCITVATSTEDDEKDIKGSIEIPVVLLDNHHITQGTTTLHHHHHHHHQQSQQTDLHIQQTTDRIIMTSPAPIMSSSCSTLTTLQTQQHTMLGHCQHQQNHQQSQQNLHQQRQSADECIRDVEILSDAQPPGPTATPVHCHSVSPARRDMAVDTSGMRGEDFPEDTKVKFETLRTMDSTSDSMETLENHMSDRSIGDEDHMQTVMITPELLGLIPASSPGPPSEIGSDGEKCCSSLSKSWTQENMDLALDALRNRHMSLTKASTTYGIPSTTLWQRAHRLGIDTPKKEGSSKIWNDEILNVALEALRAGSISANKASKAYGIPSSTLYKIARKEGIRLAAPFNATPTTWHQEDLERALEAIRAGQITVQRAAVEYGIPSGTLYGRCKREKIELSRSNPTPWSEDAMTEALESVRVGHMSINQAAIHYNLPYSSLYGRFKRGKYEADHVDGGTEAHSPIPTSNILPMSTQTSTQTQGLVSQQMQTSHQHHQEHQTSNIQPQIMVLQYQHAPSTHMQMYQPAAPS